MLLFVMGRTYSKNLSLNLINQRNKKFRTSRNCQGYGQRMAEKTTEKELRRLYEEKMYQQFIMMDESELSEIRLHL